MFPGETLRKASWVLNILFRLKKYNTRVFIDTNTYLGEDPNTFWVVRTEIYSCQKHAQKPYRI